MAGRVSQAGGISVYVGTPKARPSQVGGISVYRGTPKARSSQVGGLSVYRPSAYILQSPSPTSATTSTPSDTFKDATTAGNLLLALLVAPGTLSAPSGWSTAFNAAGSVSVALFYLANAASVTTVTAGISSSVVSIMQLAELAGMEATSPLDSVGSTATGPTSGSVTTTTARAVLMSALGQNSIATYSAPTNSFVINQQSNYTNLATVTLARLLRIVDATGTYSAGVTSSGSSPGAGGIAAFKMAAPAPTVKFRRTLSPLGARVGSRQVSGRDP